MEFRIPLKWGTGVVRLYTKYVLKFFDWDRGYSRDLGDNRLLYTSNSVTNHQINNTRTKQDFAQFLCRLSKYEKIWDMVTDMFIKTGSPVPKKRDFYVFTGEKISAIDITDPKSIKIFKGYLKANKPVLYRGHDNVQWVEVSDKLIKDIPILEESFEILYPGKPLYDFEKVYIGFKVINRDRPTEKIKVYFSHGWGCQSLFDVKDSVLRPVSKYIEDIVFLLQFNSDEANIAFRNSRIKKHMYTFPVNKPEDVAVCDYTL